MKKVKSLTIYISEEKDQLGPQKSYTEFNIEDQVLLQIEFDDEETESMRNEYSYDDKGRETEHRVYTEGNLDSYTQKTWHDDGKPKTERILNAEDAPDLEKIYDWNAERSEVHIDIHNHAEEVKLKEIQKLDAEGHLLEQVFYDEHGEEVEKYVYDYDADGNLLQKTEFFGMFENVYRYEYQFNADKKILQRTITDDENEQQSIQRNYYENGEIKEEILTETNGSKIQGLFDEDGLLATEKRYDTTGFLTIESHNFYDEDNRLARRHSLAHGKYYKIEYHYQYHEA